MSLPDVDLQTQLQAKEVTETHSGKKGTKRRELGNMTTEGLGNLRLRVGNV